MKKAFLVFISTLLLLIALTSCSLLDGVLGGGGGGGNNQIVESEYEYSFALGAGDDIVDIAYVVKTSYNPKSDFTECEVFAKVADEIIEPRFASCSFSGKDGVVSVNGQWELKLENGTLTSLAAPYGIDIITDYNSIDGTYTLAPESNIDKIEGYEEVDFTLVLRADGTGSFVGMDLTYYPLDGNSIVIFDDDGDGLVLDLNYSAMTHKPQRDSLAFNFSVGTGFANYYKVFLNSEKQMRVGTGMFNEYELYTNATHFYITGYRWVIGRYQLEGSTMKLIFDNESDGEENSADVKLTVTDDSFDYTRAVSYSNDDGFRCVYIYDNGLAYVRHESLAGQYEVAKGVDHGRIPAIYNEAEDKVYVFDKETLSISSTIQGDTYIDFSTYDEYLNAVEQKNSDTIDKIYVSSDNETVYLALVYPSTGQVHYRNLSREEGARVAISDNLLVSEYNYYFIVDDTFITVGRDSYPQLADTASTATSCQVTSMPTRASYSYYNNSNVFTEYYEDTHVFRLTWNQGSERVLYISVAIHFDGEMSYPFASYYGGRTVVDTEDGITAMVNGYQNSLTLAKVMGGALNIITYYLDRSDVNLTNLQYYETDDGYLTLWVKFVNKYYLINRDDLSVEFIIKDSEYAGLSKAEVYAMGGVEKYDDSELENCDYSFFGKLISFGNGKLYVPISAARYMGCCEYKTVEGLYYDDVMSVPVVRYSLEENWDGYYYLNGDKYYLFTLPREFDPESLEDFTGMGEIELYTSADGNIVELSRYVVGDSEYMLAFEYSLTDFYVSDGGSTYGQAVVDFVYQIFGYAVGSNGQYTLTSTIDGEVYTVITDGGIATIARVYE